MPEAAESQASKQAMPPPLTHATHRRAASSHGSESATAAASPLPHLHLGTWRAALLTRRSERRNGPTLSMAQPLRRGMGSPFKLGTRRVTIESNLSLWQPYTHTHGAGQDAPAADTA